MITIPETRTLTLYLVDSDGQPVRAADELDLDRLVVHWRSRAEALESRPIHPAVARVIDAGKVWLASDAGSDAEDDASAELYSTLLKLPSPLPTVVTCGECQFEADCQYHKCFIGGREYGPKWCSDGKRKAQP